MNLRQLFGSRYSSSQLSVDADIISYASSLMPDLSGPERWQSTSSSITLRGGRLVGRGGAGGSAIGLRQLFEGLRKWVSKSAISCSCQRYLDLDEPLALAWLGDSKVEKDCSERECAKWTLGSGLSCKCKQLRDCTILLCWLCCCSG